MIIHKLTPAQIKLVQILNKRIKKAKKPLTEFLNYIIQESELPPLKEGYGLDDTGTTIISVDPTALPNGESNVK